MAEGKPTTANLVNTEYKAMIESGLTDNNWFSMERAERAARVAYIYGRDLCKSMAEYDAVEEAKRKRGK